MNPKDGFNFNEILWSFLDQSRRWGQELLLNHVTGWISAGKSRDRINK